MTKDDRSVSQVLHNTGTLDVRALTNIALLAAITGALAFVVIPLPFSPAPITGQSLGVMLAGLLLPPGQAAMSQAVYVFLGAIGLPVFAGGASGIGVLLGPIGGYLWGFMAGAYAIGAIVATRGKRNAAVGAGFLIFASTIGGILVVHALGVLQMALVTGLPLARAAAVGALPFIPGDLVKAVAVGMIGRRLRAVRGVTT